MTQILELDENGKDPWRQGLSDLLLRAGIWADTDGDGEIDECRALLVVGRENSTWENLGCLDVAAALGLACLRFSEPVCLADDDPELETALRAGRVPILFGGKNLLYDSYRASGYARLLSVSEDGQAPECDDADGQVLLAAASGALIISGRTQRGVLLAARQLARRLARQLAQKPAAGLTSSGPRPYSAQGGDPGEAADNFRGESFGEREGTTGEKARMPISYVLNHLAYRDAGTERSLGNLFAPGVGDRAPDAGSWVFRLALPVNASPDIVKAAAELAARIGLEAAELAFPLGYLDGDPNEELQTENGSTGLARHVGVDLRVCAAAKSDSPGYVRAAADGAEIEVGGGEKGVIEALLYLAHRYPLFEPAGSSALFYTLRDLELETGDLGLAGQGPTDSEPTDLTTTDLGVEFERTWSSDAELTRVWTIWNDSVLPKLRRIARIASDEEHGGGLGGVKVRVELRTSYSRASREGIRRQLLSSLAGQGIQDAEVVVYPVHKQGFAWTTQTVLPRLATMKGGPVARVDVEFRRLEAPPGETYLDLPIRWLQELYPADELIAAQLGIGKGQVRFLVRDSGPTYRVTARDGEGRNLAGFCFDPAYSERLYLEEFAELGKIHPPTGCLKVTVAAPADFAGEVVNERITTNPEDFWDWYQKSFLREVGLRLRRQPKRVRGALVELQPFLDRAELDVECDGDDFPLGVREERFSPLESLHEDLYFVTLDYFAALGRQLCGSPFRAPGSIWPGVRPSRDGRFSARVKVTSGGEPQPEGVAAARSRTSARQGHENRIVRLDVGGGANLQAVELETGCADREQLERALAEINEVRGRFGSATSLALESEASGGISESVGRLALGRQMWSIKVLRRGQGQADGIDKGAGGRPNERNSRDDGKSGGSYEHAVIATELLEKELIRLGGLANGRLRVRPVGFSLRGRRCYAVEAVGGRPAHIDGRVKHGRRKPTLLINARHHANEVSSTTAVLSLLEIYGGVAKGGGHRASAGVGGMHSDEVAVGGVSLARMNLVVVPMENVDGVAIHEKLQREHPTWSLHAARFNALGSEYYPEYFNPKTVFAEARVLPQLWWEWQPRVVIDAHGVPSHEWVQEFAGHNSGPYFPVSYWLPGALFYGIELGFEPGGGPGVQSWSGASLQGRLKDAIIKAINANERIRLLNETWLERYRKYAADWCPEKFPASVTNGVMFLSRPAKPDGSTFTERFGLAALNNAAEAVGGVVESNGAASGNGALVAGALRIPVHFVFEVADETAQGAYLDLCMRAHLIGMLAVMKTLASLPAGR